MAPAPKYKLQQQEELVLTAAVKCIDRTSLLDFTMANIAKEAALSLGSIYKHVRSKEDVLVALATQMAKQHHSVFTEIMSLPLTMPERLMCGVLLTPEKLHSFPFGVHLEMMIGNEAIVRRASTHWLETYARINQSIDEVLNNAVTKSWSDGELVVDEKDRDRTIDMILVSLWSISIGFTQIVYQRHAWNRVTTDVNLPFPLNPDHALVESAKRLIDSFPWRNPLDCKSIMKACAMLEERGYR